MKYLTRTIWVLSLVSLFNDISSEMLYPVMPLFLQSIGFTSVLIGLLEGCAEATAGFSKGYFGRLSDSSGKRLPFVQLGYGLSAFSKSMLALFSYPAWVFGARTADKLGKGLRTGARDALLSDETAPENKGKVFGFHRGMDTLGAAIGPSLALVLLLMFPGDKLLFLLAFIPSALSILLTLLIAEKKGKPSTRTSFKFTQTFNYLKDSPNTYKKLTACLLIFALFNSSDLFLLMKIKAGGLSDQAVIGCYILYNVVFALAAFPIGAIADNLGLRKTMVAGLFIFALVYAGFGFNSSLPGFIFLFALYGIYAASTDGISKALISNVVLKSETASAIGTYTGFTSVAALLASFLAGMIWKFISPGAVFLISAGGVTVSLIFLATIQLKPLVTKVD